ncbi:MAG: acyl-CoA thioesterase [Gammaproteobacteria bacterium]|nr:acyl-CoA thioesterase [Gammaproteobacteria bacterium]MBL7000883.1 acyl-CoA thioesterase [Gammaproteobacteria bacterium]
MKLPDKYPVLKVVAMVADSNPNRTMFGGWLMGQVDIAGSIPAFNRARGGVVTAAVKSMNFLAPLYIGDLVTFYAEIVEQGRSSMTIDVDVWIERNCHDPVTLKVANARLIYVAVDDNGKVRSLP